jgi:hypothetical protein
MAESQVQKLMRLLDCSEEEAKQVIADDKAIDRGERVYFDLSKEQEKEAIKMANTGTRKKPTGYDFSKRERKANPTKGGIIAELAKFLTEMSEYATENVEITNKERQIAFKIGEDSFELTLVQKRKPKK